MASYARMHGYSIGVGHIRTFFKNMRIVTTHNQANRPKKHKKKIREPYWIVSFLTKTIEYRNSKDKYGDRNFNGLQFVFYDDIF